MGSDDYSEHFMEEGPTEGCDTFSILAPVWAHQVGGGWSWVKPDKATFGLLAAEQPPLAVGHTLH